MKAKFHEKLNVCDDIAGEQNVMKVRNFTNCFELSSQWFNEERTIMKNVLI